MKIVENAFATLRLIVLANGKKGLGAFLNLIVALLWIFSTSIVIVDINKDFLRVVAFALGSYIGSYIGCIIEEKLAIGSSLLICSSSKDQLKLVDRLRELDFPVTVLEGKDADDDKDILFIMVSRKKQTKAINIIKRIDKKATIIIESAYAYNK